MAAASGRRPGDFIGGFNFRVEIEGVQGGAFKACSGLKIETEIFEYAEGGDNSTTRKLIGASKVGNIILRKGHVESDALWKWRDELVKADGSVKRRNLSIIVCDDDGSEINRWNLFDAWPVRWEMSDFDAEQSQALVEVLEIAPERIARG